MTLVVTQYTQINNASRVFLSTIIVNVYDREGQLHDNRVLLDSSLQLNFITQGLVSLQLNHRPVNVDIRNGQRNF